MADSSRRHLPDADGESIWDKADRLFPDHVAAALRDDVPPRGYQRWAFKVLRSDRTAGGSLVWPDESARLVVGDEVVDGYLAGLTEAGQLAVAGEVDVIERTSLVGGSILLILAYCDDDVLDTRNDGVILLSQAWCADADEIRVNLTDRFLPERHRLSVVDAEALRIRERASYLGPPVPVRFDSRRRVGDAVADDDWLAHALAAYRQPDGSPRAVVVALSHLMQDPAARSQMGMLQTRLGVLRYALPWDRQLALQARVDGYVFEHFGRIDPVTEDPERPLDVVEQWLHTWPHGSEFLNLAETIIEYNADLDAIRADPDQFLHDHLPAPPLRTPPDGAPVIDGPARRFFPTSETESD